MTFDFIIKDLETTIKYFENPRNEVQAGRKYQAEKTLNQIKLLNIHSVVVPKGTFVCDHPKPYKHTPWGYKVCEKCNDIVEREQTNAL